MFKNSNNPKHIAFIKIMNNAAVDLRKDPTIAEQFLWKYLRKRRLLGYKFRRQFAIGKYIVDFICCEQKLIVEADGLIHLHHQQYDKERKYYLQLLGYKMIRFSNIEILHNIAAVLQKIASSLKGGGGSAEGRDGAG